MTTTGLSSNHGITELVSGADCNDHDVDLHNCNKPGHDSRQCLTTFTNESMTHVGIMISQDDNSDIFCKHFR